MSLFQQQTRAELIVGTIRDTTLSTYQQLVITQAEGIKKLWKNPQATPQQLCDAMGTDAAKVFSAHAKLTTLLLELAPMLGRTFVPALPEKNFTVNPDGTVTVLDEPFALPE